MRDLSISTRLFAITAGFFILFITAIMILHTTFFESYYQKQKKTDLITGLTQLKKDILAHPSDLKVLTHRFEQKYNANVAVTKYNADVSATIVRTMNSSNNDMDVSMLPPISSLSKEPEFNNRDLHWIAIEVAPQYGLHSKKYQSLVKQTSAVLYTDTSNEKVLSNQILAITDLPSEQDNRNLAEILFPKENQESIYPPSSIESETRPMLMALASLQPVGEAVWIFKKLYLYIYVVAILVILMMTFIFSRMIARPLIRLNTAATQMAKLDFSVECEVKSKDEIGSLGRTLNFLSHNLRDTIGKLHEANEQLVKDIEMEKQLEKQRKEFVAGVSHELKTPLSVISGYAEGLRDGVAKGKRREEYLDVIIEESANMTRLVTDLLDLSQLESGKFKLNLSTFDMMEMIRSVVERFQMLSTVKHVEWMLHFMETDDVWVHGDPNRIEQVLKNILINAIRHTERGGRITVNLIHLSPNEVEISITNSGEPIPDHALPYIWDPFYKADPSRSLQEQFSGTGIGIGLAIMKNILTLHQSRFRVVNGDKEVTFTFTLRKINTN